MPKLPNITNDDLVQLVARTEDFVHDAHGVLSAMEKGYADDIVNPAETAKDFAIIARAANSLVVQILARGLLQNQKAELENLKAQVAAKG